MSTQTCFKSLNRDKKTGKVVRNIKRSHWQHINTICAQMLNFPFYLSQHFFAQALLLVTKVDQVWVLGLVSDGFQALNNGGQKQKCIINCFIINAVT